MFYALTSVGAFFVLNGVKMTYTKEYLEKISLLGLRQIGREVGVKSPTSLRKDQLVESILDIQQGYIEPYFNCDKRGRPALSNQKDFSRVQALSMEKLYRIQKIISKCQNDIIEVMLEFEE